MEINETYELRYIVEQKDMAKEVAIDVQDDFPEVLATSRMIALMELAAARLMQAELADNELSVGVNVNVNHLAATPNKQEVSAIAKYTGREGKLYCFEVELHDKGGLAGKGSHTRAIIETSRLVAGANKRVG